MWQSNRSRSTGWHSPAVPPVRSASQPGENTSEQPSGMCGCCGGRAAAGDDVCSRGDVALRSRDLDARGLLIDRLEMLHVRPSSADSFRRLGASNCARNAGFRSASSP